ncbi:MAG: RNA 2',3'-cyclic phosphodiesterase [Halobacteriales archaeon]|nr:RNA 2',3'-cyclic phosphodiesterase [Halobacteriales archaeon]
MRAFVSVDLPPSFAEPIAALQTELEDAAGLNFTDPAQAHLTLKFLGDIDDDRLPEIESALETAVEDADVEPFEATVGGVGAFPSEDYIRVVWLGFTDGTAELTRLHEAIEDQMVGLGFDAEAHDFTPHVTLARMEHAGGKERVQEFLRERSPTIDSFSVEEVRLKESTLTDDGPVYSTVTAIEL